MTYRNLHVEQDKIENKYTITIQCHTKFSFVVEIICVIGR